MYTKLTLKENLYYSVLMLMTLHDNFINFAFLNTV